MQRSPSSGQRITEEPGVYALILELCEKVTVRVGERSGVLRPGVYVYVGSARGPGGVRARVTRHLRREKKIRWHVDQLTSNPSARVVGIVFARTTLRECVLTPKLESLGFEHPFPGFGSSDCASGCRSHLLRGESRGKQVLNLVVEAFRRAGLEPELALP